MIQMRVMENLGLYITIVQEIQGQGRIGLRSEVPLKSADQSVKDGPSEASDAGSP